MNETIIPKKRGKGAWRIRGGITPTPFPKKSPPPPKKSPPPPKLTQKIVEVQERVLPYQDNLVGDVTWAYGVTTVPRRRDTYLPTTLKSLAAGGFNHPRLFVDGDDSPRWKSFGLPVTYRPKPRLNIFGNWILALWELYLRDSGADRYAIFQDDVIACRSLRQYLSRAPYPEKGYCNLYTFPENERRVGNGMLGWFRSNQRGRGALGIVLSRQAVTVLLSSRHLATRPGPENPDPARRRMLVDGAIVTAMRKAGWKEYCHMPSLVQHIGRRSTKGGGSHPLAPSFPGEKFDATEILQWTGPTE